MGSVAVMASTALHSYGARRAAEAWFGMSVVVAGKYARIVRRGPDDGAAAPAYKGWCGVLAAFSHSS